MRQSVKDVVCSPYRTSSLGAYERKMCGPIGMDGYFIYNYLFYFIIDN